jgi:methionyl-tRNA formyltransferase
VEVKATKTRLAFLGTGDFAVPALEALYDAAHEIVVVVSQPDRPAGRGRQVRPSPVRSAAERLGLRHVQTADLNAENVLELFDGAEIGVVAAFGQKISAATLDALPRGFVNLHASLLPKYRGAAPFQWAIINGETETGVTVFQLDEQWDRGPIWGRQKWAIADDTTAEALHDDLARVGAALIVELLPKIAAEALTPEPQDPAGATRAPKLSKADGVVDWSLTAMQVSCRIRGLWSWPAATVEFESRSGRRETVIIQRAVAHERESKPSPEFPPGAVRSDRMIQTGQGSVRLIDVKPRGKALMSFDAFANGRDLQPGDRFLSERLPTDGT